MIKNLNPNPSNRVGIRTKVLRKLGGPRPTSLPKQKTPTQRVHAAKTVLRVESLRFALRWRFPNKELLSTAGGGSNVRNKKKAVLVDKTPTNFLLKIPKSRVLQLIACVTENTQCC